MRQPNAHQRANSCRLMDTTGARGDGVVNLIEDEQYAETLRSRRSGEEYNLSNSITNDNSSFSMYSSLNSNIWNSHVFVFASNCTVDNSNSLLSNSLPHSSCNLLPSNHNLPTSVNKSITPMPSTCNTSCSTNQR